MTDRQALLQAVAEAAKNAGMDAQYFPNSVTFRRDNQPFVYLYLDGGQLDGGATMLMLNRMRERLDDLLEECPEESIPQYVALERAMDMGWGSLTPQSVAEAFIRCFGGKG